MNTNVRKLVGAVGFASAMVLGANAQADQIALDLGVNGDGVDADALTDAFSFFTGSQLQPTSIYYDMDGNGVSSGDIVVDVAIGAVGQLNPLGFGSSREGFNDSWALETDYFLVGNAVVATGGDTILDPGEVLVGQFFGGVVGLDYIDGGLGATTVATAPDYDVEVTIQNSDVVVGNNVDVNAFGLVTSASDFVTFASGPAAGMSFADVLADPSIEISALVSTNLREANQTPVAAPAGNLTAYFAGLLDANNNLVYSAAEAAEIAGVIANFEMTSGLGAFQRFIRTTSLDSAEVRFTTELPVPAPATLGLVGLGLLGLSGRLRKKA